MAEHLVTRQQANVITEEITEAVNAILAKHGLADPKIKTTYGAYYQVKVQATPLAEGPNGVNLNSPEAQAYLAEAKWNDRLDADALGREFTVQGRKFYFAGSLTRGKKFVYSAIGAEDGRVYKFTEDIERFLSKDAA